LRYRFHSFRLRRRYLTRKADSDILSSRSLLFVWTCNVLVADKCRSLQQSKHGLSFASSGSPGIRAEDSQRGCSPELPHSGDEGEAHAKGDGLAHFLFLEGYAQYVKVQILHPSCMAPQIQPSIPLPAPEPTAKTRCSQTIY
jgi:hypothetical protein